MLQLSSLIPSTQKPALKSSCQFLFSDLGTSELNGTPPTAHLHRRSTETRVMWSLSGQSSGALTGPTENIAGPQTTVM
jgi:hypothetical protein